MTQLFCHGQSNPEIKPDDAKAAGAKVIELVVLIILIKSIMC